jgi:glutathione S-transferase
MIRLLGRKTSGNVQKVIWLLEELGLDYEREDYGRQFGNTADEAYRAMNPTGKVPTLVDGDVVVWESNTILRYLCARAGSDLLPADPAGRARAETWMDWLLASLNGPYVTIFLETKKPEAERQADLQQLGDGLAELLKLPDGQLSQSAWLAGDKMTVAEFALGPIIHRCLNFPIDLPPLEGLRRWYAEISKRPAFDKAVSG